MCLDNNSTTRSPGSCPPAFEADKKAEASVGWEQGGELLHLNRSARQLAAKFLRLLLASDHSSSVDVSLCLRGPEQQDAERWQHTLVVEVLGRRQEIAIHQIEPGHHEAEPLEVLAELAHDLNNLLTPLVALRACLEIDLPDGVAAREQAREIRVTAERAAHCVKQTLVSLSQETDRVGLVHLGSVVSNMRELLRHVAGASVHVETRVARGTGLVMLDRHRLEAALVDLIANARDAIQGQGSITIRTASISVTAPQARTLGQIDAGEYVLVEVQDTGSGVEASLRQRIFDRCFTTKPDGHGSGLGLYHVRKFATESHGHVHVHSQQGGGTTFSLYFPRIAAKALS